MPIIPRYDSIQGGIPTPRIPTPDIESFPGTQTAHLMKGVSSIGMDVAQLAGNLRRQGERAAVKEADRQGAITAETLKTETAVRLSKAMEDVKRNPQKTIEGIEVTGGDPGGLDEPVATTSLIPRSQTVEVDYLKAQEDIINDVRKKAGSEYVMKHLRAPLARMMESGSITMQKQTTAYMEQERNALVTEDVDLMSKAASALVPMLPGKTPEGGAKIALGDDAGYENLRSGVIQKFKNAVVVHGMRPDWAEDKMLTKLVKMDNGRASQTMTADPAGWIEATMHDRNEWKDRITGDAMQKLTDSAVRITKDKKESSGGARLEAQRAFDQDAFLLFQEGKLTPEFITAGVKNRVIESSHAEHWTKKMDERASGDWPSDGATRLRFLEMAHDPNVDKHTFYKHTFAAMKPGGLNAKDAGDLNKVAAGIADRRFDDKMAEANQANQGIHSVVSTALATPHSFLNDSAKDQKIQVIRTNAYADRAKAMEKDRSPEAQHKWLKERLPFYQKQMTGFSQAQIDVSNARLGGLRMKTDPKTGFIEMDEVKKSRTEAFKQAGINPQDVTAEFVRSGRFPAGLKEQLRHIQDVVDHTAHLRTLPAER